MCLPDVSAPRLTQMPPATSAVLSQQARERQRHSSNPGSLPKPALHPDIGRGWMRRVWPIVALQRWTFIGSVLAGLAATAATVSAPILIGRGVDAAIERASLTPWVIGLCFLAAVRFGFGFLYRYGLFRSAHRIEADLRNLVYERLTELSFSYWDRVQSGQVISRANTDIRSIQLLFAFGPLVAMQLVLLAAGFAVMLVLSPALTLAATAPLPIVFYVGLRLRRLIFPLSWVVQARMADVATIVDENIGGARVVKAFAQEKRQVQTLAGSARRLRWAGTATADTRARHTPLMEALPRIGLALVLLYGGSLVIDGAIDVGDLVTFNAFVLLMATPFNMIGFVLIQWQRAAAAALRVFEILDEPVEITEPPNALPLARPAGRVEFRDVAFSYPIGNRNKVLDGFSLVIEPGETIALVGRTGCGKSTVTRLLPRFYDADRGAVSIDGHDVRDLKLADLRRAVLAVTEEPFLFARSVRDNVAFARGDAGAAEVAQALADAAATQFVNDLPLGLATELGERGADISGGQRQRLAIARALVADPAVLILDDSTSAIDVAIEALIHEALRRRHAQRTTILISHRLSTIALADRVVYLAGGKVAAVGDHHQLLRDEPGYAEVLTDGRYRAGSSS